MDNSPLSRLPPEIRNQIYAMTLEAGSGRPIVIPERCHLQIQGAKPDRHLGALRHTCSEIRRECTRMYYASNVVVLIASEDVLDRLTALRDFIDRSGMTNLQITIHIDFENIALNESVSWTAEVLNDIAHFTNIYDCRASFHCQEMIDFKLEDERLDFDATTVVETLEAMNGAVSSAAAGQKPGKLEDLLRSVSKSLTFALILVKIRETDEMMAVMVKRIAHLADNVDLALEECRLL